MLLPREGGDETDSTEAKQEHPGEFFYKKLTRGIRPIGQGRLRSIEKFVVIGVVCACPKLTPVPFKEEDIWNRYLEETNALYKLAKEMLLMQSRAADAAKGTPLVTKHCNGVEPVDINAGFEITIKELVEKIAAPVGFQGQNKMGQHKT